MTIRDLKDNIVNVQTDTMMTLISEEALHSHWGWWVLWLIVFWPLIGVLVFFSLTRKKYIVKLTTTNSNVSVVELDSRNYKLLCSIN